MKFKKGQKLALLSVYHKDGIVDFAKALIKLGYKIVSSGGTAKCLKEWHIPVTDVAEITGMPAILGHRVVTLHPKIHGGILAKNTPEHDAERKKYGIPRFDIVCVDIYPVLDGINKNRGDLDAVMELTDIGGPTMLRGAAKNHNNGTIVICDPADRSRVLKALKKSKSREVSWELRRELAFKVFDLMAKYDTAISQYLAQMCGKQVETIFLEHVKELAYAENKCQNPADLFKLVGDTDPLSLPNFQVLAGNPSYIASADASGILRIIRYLGEAFRLDFGNVPHIAVAGKHGNPCGAAFDWSSPEDALKKALYGDTIAIMGGEVVVNFPIDDALGQLLYAPGPADEAIGRQNWGLDLVMAPSVTPNTVELLGKKEKRRILVNPALLGVSARPEMEWGWSPILGGFLRQKPYPSIDLGAMRDTSVGPSMLDSDRMDILLALVVCWCASSNTVALAKDGMLLSLGCGQQDRIACVRLCLDRALHAGHDIKDSFFASDGFFPYATSQEPGELALHRLVKMLVQSADEAFAYLRPSMPNTKKALRILVKAAAAINQQDNREGAEMLIDAGCKGGIVPADGKNLAEVKKLFKDAGLSVIFVKPEFRGFAKH